MLRDLLTTWETWSARDTVIRALDRASTDEAGEALNRSLSNAPEIDPLDALRNSAELVALLRGWQWQPVYAARLAGSSWDEIARVTGSTAQRSRAAYVAAVDLQERRGMSDTCPYREVL